MGHRIDIPEGEYLQGLDEVVGRIQSCVENMESGSSKGLLDALVFVASESQPRAPVETGDLRGSVKVELDGQVVAEGEKGNKEGKVNIIAFAPPDATRGEVSYNTIYAAQQHEQIEYDHPNGGQAKYLESVLVENTDRILALIGDGIVNELFGGGE